MTHKDPQDIVIVTGLSGAGMSSALKALEDQGYEVLDNFPVAMIGHFLASELRTKPLAIGIDTRTRGFDPEAVIRTAGEIGARLLFLTAEEAVLQKRFTETRRKHPLATDRPVSAGIRKELEILHSLRDAADIVLDTSTLTIHDLRRQVAGHFSKNAPRHLSVSLISFGFKYGLPREADIVLDVRFLKNPHWDDVLKHMTGKDPAVAAYIAEDPALEDFMRNAQALLHPLFPRYVEEGKQYLTLAIGCTGGKHRSVYVAEKLSGWIKEQAQSVHLHHRDIDR